MFKEFACTGNGLLAVLILAGKLEGRGGVLVKRGEEWWTDENEFLGDVTKYNLASLQRHHLRTNGITENAITRWTDEDWENGPSEGLPDCPGGERREA